MLLTIDVGNTNITLGVFKGTKLIASGRIASDPYRMADEYGLILSNLLPAKGVNANQITGVSMCSVVPQMTATFVELCKKYIGQEPLIVGAGVKTGVRVLYDTPKDVGSDRIVDAVSAFKTYGGPCIVVDFGTATVFDAISAKGDYLGGAIAPGLDVSAESLYKSTSQLRRVELNNPTEAIGKNTIHSLQSGLVLGYYDMVKGMVSRFKNELGEDSKVIATGGHANLFGIENCLFAVIDLNLTLSGLRIIYELNQ